MAEPSARSPHYAPDRRTALVLTGSGVDGAYHAGAVRALNEAGVRVDLVAGRGVGAVAALFAAIDGASRLWEPTGLVATPGRTSALPVARGAASCRGGPVRWRPRCWWCRRWCWRWARRCIRSRSCSTWWAAAPARGWRSSGRRCAWWPSRPTGCRPACRRSWRRCSPSSCVAVAVAALRARASAPARRDLRGGVWWTVLGAPLTRDAGHRLLHHRPVGSAARRRPRHAAGARRLEPALRRAARRQPGPAGLSRAADRRPRSRRAAGPGVRAAGPRLAAAVLPAAADHRARPSIGRSGRPGRRGARPRARRGGRRAHLAGGDRRAADRICGRRATGAAKRIGSPIDRPRWSACSRKWPAPACAR